MNSLDKMDLIDLYYPTDETIAALLTVPPEQRETLLRRNLANASEAGMDPHISRVSGNDRCILRQRSVMEIGYLSAFVLSQLYRWFPSVLTASGRGPRRNSLDSWGGCPVRGHRPPVRNA